MTPMEAQAFAQKFHEAYERLAPTFGYQTREASAKPWTEVPENNRKLMVAVCQEVVADALTAAYAQGRRNEQDAIVKRVEVLVGKDSGNWNRAITYALEAIRAQAAREGKS